MMLQTFQDTAHYAQPRSPIEVTGERYTLPPDLITGLAFLRRFTRPKGQPIEQLVHASGNRLDVLTNSIAVEYMVGACDLPPMDFGPRIIRLLEAFGAPPVCLEVEKSHLNSQSLFHWDNGQNLFSRIELLGDWTPSAKARLDLMERLWHKGGLTIDDEARKDLFKSHKGFGPDIYVNRNTVISRRSRKGEPWTSETATGFPIEVERPMRFDLDSFLLVIGVADEIDFSTSPVSFRHANGRGLLIERTLGSDVPDREWSDD